MAHQTSGMDEILSRWRNIVKDKKRQIITPEETIGMKIASLKQWLYVDPEPVTGWMHRPFHYTRKGERRYAGEDWRPIAVGDTWGGPDVSAEFRTRAVLPARYAGKRVVLQVYFGGDGLLSVNGEPYHGLDPFRNTVPLTECAQGGEEYDLACESYIFWHAGESEVKHFECSHLAVLDTEMNDIYWDLVCAYKVMMADGETGGAAIDPEVRGYVQDVLARATAFIDQNEADPLIFRENAQLARGVVREGLYEAHVFQRPGLMHLNGNSHLDICFMWTHAEFLRKIGRTHATALRLMEQYSHYKFSQSQPLLYEEMQRHYPDLFRQVKARVAEGRWEALGAFYVEPDCNLISGESFVRQILFGVRFMEREFGVTPRTAWIPDVFGSAWTMPQILVRSGLEFFVTHKMVLWNDTNKWITHVFWWQGPDGSRIFATVPPTGFIGTLEPDHMAEHWQKYSAKHTIGESLYNYGWGDGGGGPDVEMLESIKRYNNFPGMTPTKTSLNEEALESMRTRAIEAADAIPVVNDELYLEEHRGTYTSQAVLKRLNRFCEILYRKAELFSCFADVPWPREALQRGWRRLLVNQFHDSLPGSHVHVVHEDLVESYQEPVEIGGDILDVALQDLAGRIDTRGEGHAVVVFNAQPFVRNSVATLEFPEQDLHIVDAEGREVPHQFITHFETGQCMLAFYAAGVPAVGYRVFRILSGPPGHSAPAVKATPTSLEHQALRVLLNERGEIVSLYDKTIGRECIDGEIGGNLIRLFEDEPGRHEAWDIVSTYREHEFDMGKAELEVVEEGPLRSAIQITRTFRNSRMVQRVVLSSVNRRVDFETRVDWHEQRKLLKVEFHTPILARQATFDIAFGAIDRPTTRNNSYEAARFEVPAHLWMDLSQSDFGLSLLNDSKYGHEAHGRMMALTLLKGPTFPDPQADQGEHAFTYSLFPHRSSWREGNTVEEALDLNDPVDAVLVESHNGPLPATGSFISIDAPSVTLEALKRAEDGDDLILRVVERHGAQADVRIGLSLPIAHAVECNLLERADTPVQYDAESLWFTILPFEIRTFRMSVA